MTDDGQWTTDDRQRVITIAHPELCSGELKIDFQDGGHLGLRMGTILAIRDSSTRHLIIPFSLEEEAN